MIFLFLALWYPSCALFCWKICKKSQLTSARTTLKAQWHDHFMPRNLVHTSLTTCCEVWSTWMHPSWSTATYTLAFKEKALKSRQGLPGYQRVEARVWQNWTIVKFERKCNQASEERWLKCHAKDEKRTGTRRGKLTLRTPAIFVKVNLNLVLPFKG